eukprot:5391797-Prymnesium_polylepis.1
MEGGAGTGVRRVDTALTVEKAVDARCAVSGERRERPLLRGPRPPVCFCSVVHAARCCEVHNGLKIPICGHILM